jgi:predicted Zn-dependent peptidase
MDLGIVMDAIAELTSGEPYISPEDLQDALASWNEQVMDHMNNPASSQVSHDLTFRASYGQNLIKGSLGNPTLSVREDITAADLRRVAKKLFRRDGAVLFGLSIDHDTLVDITKKLFPPVNYTDSAPLSITTNTNPKFIGDELKIEFLEEPQELGKQNLPALTQMTVTFEGISWKTHSQDK